MEVTKDVNLGLGTSTLAPFAVSVSGCSWEPAGKFELLQWMGLSDANGTDVYEVLFY